MLSLIARHAATQGAGGLDREVAIVEAVGSVPVERLVGRAGAGTGRGIVGEVLGSAGPGDFFRVCLAVEWVGFFVVYPPFVCDIMRDWLISNLFCMFKNAKDISYNLADNLISIRR